MRIIRRVAFPAAVVCLTILGLLYDPGTPVPATPDRAQIAAEARRGGYRLIETDALWELYRSEPDKILLVDTRQDWEFRAGHIAGALSFPMTPTWWARWRERGALRKFLGNDKERAIVFY
jgi:hypothetical protein